MQIQNSRWLILIILMAVIFFAGLFFGKNQSMPPEATVPTIQKPATEPESEIPEPGATDPQEGDVQTVLSSDGKNSYRVKSGAGKSKPVRAPSSQTRRTDVDWENEYESRDVLESALAGDENDVIAVGELIAQCRGMSDDVKRLENQLNNISRNVQSGNPLPMVLIPGTGEKLKFTNFVEYEEFTLSRFAQCQATQGLFNNAMRDRLEELAKSGSVTARFLYAMWVPDQNVSNTMNLMEWLTYQGLAWDFTWANIREGEPLGLLAYGRSLEQSGSIYFTPRHFNFGPAFILAAQKCGLENKTVDQKIVNMTDYWSEKNMTLRFNRAESLSDQIANMFCR